LKHTIYKILIYAPHTPRTNLYSVHSLSVSATEQLVQGRMQLSYLPSKMNNVITTVVPSACYRPLHSFLA